MVRPMTPCFRAALMSVWLLVGFNVTALAEGGNGNSTPQPASAPASQGQAGVSHGRLEAGAAGTYLPMTPDVFTSPRTDPRNPLYIAPTANNPQGQRCPNPADMQQQINSFPAPDVPGGHILHTLTLYPTFTRNAQGGYDGHDATFGYEQPNAIPPGGDPSQNALGQLATENTIAGRIIAVDAYLLHWGTWQDAQPNPPYGGYCAGVGFGFTPAYIAGNAPPPGPPLAVLNTPPFAPGPALVSQVSRSWTIGSVKTLPGPEPTTRTYVHIPTCAWLQSSVPTAPVPYHSVTTATVAGYTLFLVYNVQVTPGPVTWDWGDASQSSTSSAIESPPATLPAYNPTAQTWTNPCNVSHAYDRVADTRTITATETFTVVITVSWSDGVSVHTAPVPCDPVSNGPCTLTLGAAQGWSSGPHPVDQIEPVPFNPPPPSH
jgi:hypothetical protein